MRAFSFTEKSQYSHFSWSQTGPAIFTFVIAVQTFCRLFLCREWSNRTCHIIHVVAWSLLLLQLCIENFVLADGEKGPYYGISTAAYWCWISPQYIIERYTTDYLYMTASATFSFILYTLVFFRLRGNIRVSENGITFHRRPIRNIGHVRTYLDSVARNMLWYPVVYTILVLPMAATRFSSFSNLPVPFEMTIIAAGVFMLHGFFNTLLFCTTLKILP
jgi:hypothetical protein